MSHNRSLAMSCTYCWVIRGSLAGLLFLMFLPPGLGASSKVSVGQEFMRGVTISCPRAGQIWGTPKMDAALSELKELGSTWVAIHPYAWVNRTGEVRFDPQLMKPDSYLFKAAKKIDTHGLKYFVKPHLGYWGSFKWRGEIGFGNDESRWKRFFESYTQFIYAMATYAEAVKAPLFSVGIEYQKTLNRPEWITLIQGVRKRFSGKITYAANWDQIHRVPFWSQLDFIGVQAYFPLAKKLGAEFVGVKAWAPIVKQLKSVSDAHKGKPILFTEIGYDRSEQAAVKPWESRTKKADASTLKLRRSLVRAVLDLEGSAAFPFAGLFWWKWMPGEGHWHDNHDRDFAMRHEDARTLLRSTWGSKPATENKGESSTTLEPGKLYFAPTSSKTTVHQRLDRLAWEQKPSIIQRKTYS